MKEIMQWIVDNKELTLNFLDVLPAIIVALVPIVSAIVLLVRKLAAKDEALQTVVNAVEQVDVRRSVAPGMSMASNVKDLVKNEELKKSVRNVVEKAVDRAREKYGTSK